jgi:hypothetical protein
MESVITSQRTPRAIRAGVADGGAPHPRRNNGGRTRRSRAMELTAVALRLTTQRSTRHFRDARKIDCWRGLQIPCVVLIKILPVDLTRRSSISGSRCRGRAPTMFAAAMTPTSERGCTPLPPSKAGATDRLLRALCDSVGITIVHLASRPRRFRLCARDGWAVDHRLVAQTVL